jgi:hypothetical protein
MAVVTTLAPALGLVDSEAGAVGRYAPLKEFGVLSFVAAAFCSVVWIARAKHRGAKP